MGVVSSTNWWKTGAWSLVLVLMAMAVLWIIPTADVVIAPGITGNLASMVKVRNGHPPGRGKMMMVAVSILSANALVYLYAHFDPALELLSKRSAMGNMTMQQYQQYNLGQMQLSQDTAEVVGERLAGLPARAIPMPGALVAGVFNGPAAGKLRVGDAIVAIGPYRVSNYTHVRSILHRFQFGDIVTFTVIRDGRKLEIPIRTTRMAGDPDPAVGVSLARRIDYVIPRRVLIKSQGIGGPSAGMMFSLEIYDQITGRDVAKGRMIAGTGELSANGSVTKIGGVGQKVITVEHAGATIFLCPLGNYPQAMAMKRAMGYHHLKIYPVANVQQALEDLSR
ncbi:MAG: PDZ domain-containing protein [Firmicutes bacterium]|jgi:PDZ domain-containing protein|nr:PDZ domain-containing protein [Bacillota bacterium]MCL5064798.1 PDZ domain-containing protein [Bacillota bacterium]